MNIWWDTLMNFEKFFWAIAIPSSCLFVVQIGLLIMGIDSAGDVPDSIDVDSIGEVDFDGDMDDLEFNSETDVHSSNIPLKLITFRNVVIFLTVFSWTGITAIDNELGKTTTVIISIIVASIVVGILTAVFRALLKLQESGNINPKNAIGKEGKVYLTIPEKESGMGKIEIVFQGKYQVVDSVTKGQALKTGIPVKVVGIRNGNYVVEAL